MMKEVRTQEVKTEQYETVYVITVPSGYERLFTRAINELNGEIAQNEAEIAISNEEDRAFMRYLERKNYVPDYPDEADYYPDVDDYCDCEPIEFVSEWEEWHDYDPDC